MAPASTAISQTRSRRKDRDNTNSGFMYLMHVKTNIIRCWQSFPKFAVSQCLVKGNAKPLYSMSIHDGCCADVLQAIKQCSSTWDVKPIRWLVTKGELAACTVALSGALTRPPTIISKHVKTMSQFVDELGKVLQEW